MKQRFFSILFNIDGIELLEKDLGRRFSKPEFAQYGLWQRIKYLKRNVQYLTLVYYRLAFACKRKLLKKFFLSQYQKYSIKTGIEFLLPSLGGGLIMPHWGRIILNAKSIGENLYVFHNVTIGNDYASGVPEIGRNVFIGVNSTILGDIKIGDNVVIGACSFVDFDIPSNSMVVGNPAKVIKTIDDEYIKRMIGY